MSAYCVDFNVYKQANINMVIRSWQYYRRFLGAISFLYHHDNVYPCAGGSRKFSSGLAGGGGGFQARLTEKSSDVVFSSSFFFCKSSANFAEGVLQ